MRFEQGLQIGRVLVNQIVEGNEHALGAIGHKIGGVQGKLAEEAVGQVDAGRKKQVLFFVILSLRNLIPGDMHVGQLLHALEQFHLVGIAVQGTYADDEAEIGRFIRKGILGGQRSGCAKHHQKGQYQAEQPFHQGYLLYFSTLHQAFDPWISP